MFVFLLGSRLYLRSLFFRCCWDWLSSLYWLYFCFPYCLLSIVYCIVYSPYCIVGSSFSFFTPFSHNRKKTIIIHDVCWIVHWIKNCSVGYTFHPSSGGSSVVLRGTATDPLLEGCILCLPRNWGRRRTISPGGGTLLYIYIYIYIYIDKIYTLYKYI